MIEPTDFVYENAPLIEVIAEIRWNMVALASMPGAAVDPMFGRASGRLTDAFGKLGYTHVERLIPPEVPQEVVAYQPVLRYRREANKWPLFQIGPGLFTINVTMPYKGWNAFHKVIQLGLQALDQTYGLSKGLIELGSLQLRYVNGFTAKHGMVNYAEFCRADLGLVVTPPPDLLATSTDPRTLDFAVEFGFPLAEMEASAMGIKCARGQAWSDPAAIVELSITRQGRVEETEAMSVTLAWLEEAHKLIRSAFLKMASPHLKDAMGPARPLEELQ